MGETMSYDAILFDLDGVLLTGRQTADSVYRRSTAAMLEAHGRQDVSAWPEALENPDSAADFRRTCDKFDIPADAAWGYRERTATQFETARIANGDRLTFPDADVLTDLAPAHEVGIVSNNRHCLVAWCVQNLEWGDAISAYRGRYPILSDYDRMKPDPTFLVTAIDQLEGKSVLFVGDRRSDVLTAERVGCDSALLARNGCLPPGDAEPTYVIESLTELLELHDTG